MAESRPLRRLFRRLRRIAGLVPAREAPARLAEVPNFNAAADGFRAEAPLRNYVICSVPRSGSTLLGHGLWVSGLGGKPAEYFNVLHYGRLLRRWGSLTFAARLAHRALEPEFSVFTRSRASLLRYVRDLAVHRTGGNGVFGVKLHHAQYRRSIAPLLLRELFPGVQVISIRRRSRIRQAVSLLKARQTNRYRASQTPSGRAEYVFTGLLNCHLEILLEEQNWDGIFAVQGLAPLRLDYEDVAADYEGSVLRALRFIGVEPPPGFQLPPPALRKEADASSEEWLARYVADLDAGAWQAAGAAAPFAQAILVDRAAAGKHTDIAEIADRRAALR